MIAMNSLLSVSATYLLFTTCLHKYEGVYSFVTLKVNNKLSPSFITYHPNNCKSILKTSSSGDIEFETQEEERIGNLVADDEWMGLSMELSEVVRLAVVEDIKKSTREFTGKDDYKVGDISKEIDDRVKKEIASLRGKDEYELGDLTAALDTLAKDMTCELTGKEEYEFGDLSTEIDTRVKTAVSEFCGKDEYELGDLSKEISSRVQDRVKEFTSKDDYEIGDISREIESRRKQWVEDFLGKEAAENYQVGDVTKKAISSFTGKDEYEFGDVTKKIVGNIFGGKKKKGGEE